ncbi:MAG: LysR family transcriptional regulator, partial [Pseudomonadota bacterium]
MENWDEVRTAYYVARSGTVSKAAQDLGVHHATVIRHIDALEHRLGVKLFQRHARGYAVTEAGQDLLHVAQATDEQFAILQNRLKGHSGAVSGDLTVTTLSNLSPFLAPALTAFRATYPDIRLRLLTGARLFRLEYGEAHVAIRAGAAPDDPDNVVQKFIQQKVGLFAATEYLDQHGPVKDEADFCNHWFIGAAGKKGAPFHKWLDETVGADRIVFRGSDNRILEDALVAGMGVGFMTCDRAKAFPNLRMVMPPKDIWSSSVWIVTHVDLHRTAKVQAFL